MSDERELIWEEYSAGYHQADCGLMHISRCCH